MKKKEEIITKLELIAAEAWPAKTMEPFGEWILRANDGVSKRANSLLAIGTIPTDSWLHIYESFYKSYEIEPCVYISEVTPKEVVEKLFAHDYEVVTKMYILTNEVNTVLKQTKRDPTLDRKSTRLNSSHVAISYAVFCLKKKNITNNIF